MVPPVSAVARAVHYLSLLKAKATLIVPLWPSFSFRPLLACKYRSFIKAMLYSEWILSSHPWKKSKLIPWFSHSQVRLSLLDSNFCRDWPTFSPSSRFLN